MLPRRTHKQARRHAQQEQVPPAVAGVRLGVPVLSSAATEEQRKGYAAPLLPAHELKRVVAAFLARVGVQDGCIRLLLQDHVAPSAPRCRHNVPAQDGRVFNAIGHHCAAAQAGSREQGRLLRRAL